MGIVWLSIVFYYSISFLKLPFGLSCNSKHLNWTSQNLNMHPGKTIKGSSHFTMALFLMLLGICENSKPVLAGFCLVSTFSLSAQPSQCLRTQMCFISQGCDFCRLYNPRVATISFDQKRERGFDEQLARILKFKQKYWAPLVREMGAITTIYSH